MLSRFHLASNSNLLNRTNFHHSQDDAYAFKRFVFRHVEAALTDGWTNDGISSGARSESSPFELCTYSVWKRLFTAVRELLDTTPATNKSMRQAFAMLHANIDPDGQLSETRSKKYLPNAIRYYEEGLPPRYTKHFHEQRVSPRKYIGLLSEKVCFLVKISNRIFWYLCARIEL